MRVGGVVQRKTQGGGCETRLIRRTRALMARGGKEMEHGRGGKAVIGTLYGSPMRCPP